MNILVYRWNSYNYIDIIATFQSMGHQVDVIEQELESYDEDESFVARLHGILQQKNYDFVFTELFCSDFRSMPADGDKVCILEL